MSEALQPTGYRGLARALEAQEVIGREGPNPVVNPLARRPRRRMDSFHPHWYCEPCAKKWEQDVHKMRDPLGQRLAVQTRHCEYCGIEQTCYLLHETDEVFNLKQKSLLEQLTQTPQNLLATMGNLLKPATTLPTTRREMVEQIARMCHETNKHYCRSIGDFTQHCWEEAEQWQRDSAIAGVEFRLANPGAGPAATHESWMRQKVNDGWIYGPVKDPAKKEHPSMLPYEQLPVEERLKDYLFGSIVHSYVAAGAVPA